MVISFQEETSRPSTESTVSPALIPAAAAGLSGSTSPMTGLSAAWP